MPKGGNSSEATARTSSTRRTCGSANFAADFVDHGADVPPGMPPGGRYYYNYALRGERLRLNVTGPVPVLQASRRSRFGKQRFFLFFSTFDLLTFEIS